MMMTNEAVQAAAMKNYNDLSGIPSGINYPSSVTLYKYENCIVQTVISTNRYTQYNTTYYLTWQEGAKFASKMELGDSQTLAILGLGFIPKYGPGLAVAGWFLASLNDEHIAAIRRYTDRGKKVCIKTCRSEYGPGFSVSEWVGNTCIMSQVEHKTGQGGYYQDETVQTVMFK